jgi:hypothetical protein
MTIKITGMSGMGEHGVAYLNSLSMANHSSCRGMGYYKFRE